MVLTENTIGFLLQATYTFIGTSINSKYLCVLNKMEYTIEEYNRSFGRVFTTFDDDKYIQSEKYNALRKVYPQVKLCGCWFHYTQSIWAKIQKLGLVHAFRNNTDTRSFIKQLMADPFLPGPLIKTLLLAFFKFLSSNIQRW